MLKKILVVGIIISTADWLYQIPIQIIITKTFIYLTFFLWDSLLFSKEEEEEEEEEEEG